MTHLNRTQTFTFPWKETSRTGLFVIIQGTLFGLIGMIHGIYEILQGNTPTGGYLLEKMRGNYAASR